MSHKNPTDPVVQPIDHSKLYGMPCEPIPRLPGQPEYPVQQITDEELREYIIPLYSRKWSIHYTWKRPIMTKENWYKCAVLHKGFEFATFESTMDFVEEVSRLAQIENVSLLYIVMHGC